MNIVSFILFGLLVAAMYYLVDSSKKKKQQAKDKAFLDKVKEVATSATVKAYKEINGCNNLTGDPFEGGNDEEV